MAPILVLVTGLPGTGKTTIAEGAARQLAAAVVSHDRTMADLKTHPHAWEAIRQLDAVSLRTVGWNLMWSVAREQLQSGSSVILDGVARAAEIAATREIAIEEDVRTIVVLCSISDRDEHKRRVLSRRRDIPNWDELTWENVEWSIRNFDPASAVDLELDAMATFEANLAEVVAHASGTM